MIKYYIYQIDKQTSKEVSKDVFYSAMRLFKANRADYTSETVNRYVNGELVKEKRLVGHFVYYLP